MDFWQHIGSGRLAELLGDSAIETDQFLRTLGWERIAQVELGSTSAEQRAVLQAYADGVNAYLADHPGSQPSLEYAILKLINSDCQVEPWQPVYTLTWAKVMAWDLGGDLTDEISKAIMSI
jgi:penicillin amidase